MKKILSYIVLALSLVTLVACGKSEAAKLTRTSSQQSQSQGKVTLILKTEKESKKKAVNIQKGDTVLDVLEEVYPVQENDGLRFWALFQSLFLIRFGNRSKMFFKKVRKFPKN